MHYNVSHRVIAFILIGRSLIQQAFTLFMCIVRPANRDWACQTERCHTLSNKTSLQ